MDKNIPLHNINKQEIEKHLLKILDLHDAVIVIIKKYIEEYENNPEFKQRASELKEFNSEIIKGKEHFIKWGIEGIVEDIKSFPYECIVDTLPISIEIREESRFQDLYYKIQEVFFTEGIDNIPRTEKTLWAYEIKKAVDVISDFYSEVIKSQLSTELLGEFQKCLTHYIKLWEAAIQKTQDAIEFCERTAELTYMIPILQLGKGNLESRKTVPERRGINELILDLRSSPISDPRGALDIVRGMDELLGSFLWDKKYQHLNLRREIDDAVVKINRYYASGYGFRNHKRFNRERLNERTKLADAKENKEFDRILKLHGFK